MAFKIKQERLAPELENARAKLDSALQYLLEKPDDSPSTSEDECNKILSEMAVKQEPSPIATPIKKTTQRAQRKRRRKDEAASRNANSYVMKLFDRAVDLAPFSENDPLYPICRAWINNQSPHHITLQSPKIEPINNAPELTEDGEHVEDDTITDEIYNLPAPMPVDKNAKDIRIPSPIPQPQEEFIICSDEQNTVTNEMLMAKHLQRWKAVRQKWKQAARANEERYKESGMVLKEIFERAQQQQDETLIPEQWDAAAPVAQI